MAERTKNVLVVEDDEELRNTLVNALARAGFGAFGASSVREARSKLRNQKFACLLFDIHLGDERADEVIAELRGLRSHPNADTPIIVVSGHLDRDLIGSIRAHVQGALVKPFRLDAVLEAVKRVAG